MSAQPDIAVRIPYVLTEAGMRITDEMRAEHPRITPSPKRRCRRWVLTDAAHELLDNEA